MTTPDMNPPVVSSAASSGDRSDGTSQERQHVVRSASRRNALVSTIVRNASTIGADGGPSMQLGISPRARHSSTSGSVDDDELIGVGAGAIGRRA